MGRSHSAEHVAEDAARMGFIKTRVGPDFRTVRWQLRCSKCPQEFTASWDAGMKPEAMARQLRKRQWDVGYGMRPLCPKCTHSKDRGPNPKPEHQNFKRWIPPETLVFDRLLDAANKRAAEARRPRLIAEIVEVGLQIEEAKADKKVVRATMMEEARAAGAKARLEWARRMKLQRQQQDRARQAEPAVPSAPARAITQQTAPVEQGLQPAKESAVMQTTKTIAPAPKISHAVFQCLDGVFDPDKRLYRSGYTDQRVAKECGTSEDVVAYLRTETFGQLAEDPRYSALRDDLELLGMSAAEQFAKLQKELGEIRSRVEQLARS